MKNSLLVWEGAWKIGPNTLFLYPPRPFILEILGNLDYNKESTTLLKVHSELEMKYYIRDGSLDFWMKAFQNYLYDKNCKFTSMKWNFLYELCL